MLFAVQRVEKCFERMKHWVLVELCGCMCACIGKSNIVVCENLARCWLDETEKRKRVNFCSLLIRSVAKKT